jgi:4-amino-4-deoxy-L-arabinose transferase-like glycosyltransferase
MTLPESKRTGFIVALSFGIAVSAYHIILSLLPGYGYFIDEFYYIACSKRLAFGYVDHPPLSILLLALNRALFGDGLTATRLIPSLAVGGAVFLTGLITRRLGGTTPAVVIACLGAAAMPVFMVMGSFYSMNALEILVIAAILYLVVRMLAEEEPRYWIAIGILTGLGLELKHTMGVYAVALVAGMLLTPARRLLWNRWALLGGVCAALLIMPNLVWQAVNGFPSLEFYRNAMVYKNIPKGPVGVLVDQIMFVNPFALPLWLGGLVFFFVTQSGRRYRTFGWAYLFLLAMMIVSKSSRPDRIGAVYPVLFAGGAVAIGIIGRSVVRRVTAGAALAVLTVSTVVLAPIFTPVLSPAHAHAFLARLGLSLNLESGKVNQPLPQWLGDRLGWKELTEEVARVCHALPSEEQRNAVIVSNNYGAAGAFELYGPAYGLPPVYATHNSFHSWGPPPDSARTFIAVMVSRRDLEQLFEQVEEAGMQKCEYCTGPQQAIHIYIARRPRGSVSAGWPGFKIYS